MPHALAALLGTVAVIAALVALLRLAKAAGERLAHADTEPAPVRVRPAVAPGPGYLSDEEQSLVEWETQGNRRDLDRLAAVHKVFEHRMNRLFERILADPRLDLDQTGRNWARVRILARTPAGPWLPVPRPSQKGRNQG